MSSSIDVRFVSQNFFSGKQKKKAEKAIKNINLF